MREIILLNITEDEEKLPPHMAEETLRGVDADAIVHTGMA